MKVALVLLLAAATAHAQDATQFGEGAGFDAGTVYKVPLGGAPSDGPADAPITIVDWSDYACGYCNRVQDTLDRLERLYPGQIRWVHRALPLDDDDTLAIEAAHAAAAQGRFRAMHQRLYAVHGRVDRADVELFARELGLDVARVRHDLDTHAYRDAIRRDLDDARALGITGTPMFFVNGRPVHGNQSLAVFASTVDEELQRAKALGKVPDIYAAAIASGKLAADAAADAGNPPIELDPKQLYRVGAGLPGQQSGPDDALVTIIEWSDFECPFCAKEAPVLAAVRAKYGNDVRVIFRHFPVRFHRESMIAAEAGAAAAAQGKFWAFHDQVFAHFGKLSRADLVAYAKAAGLDVARFTQALDDRRYHDAVVEEGAAAEAIAVVGTPTLFINGHPVVGAQSEAVLDRIVEAQIDAAKQAMAHGLPRADLYAVLMSMAHGDDRADPSAVPEAMHVEQRGDDRARSVTAACRRGDTARSPSKRATTSS